MPITVEIDDTLLAEVLKATGARSEREAVELGFKALLRMRRQADIREARGKLPWTGDLDAMRTDR